MGQPDSNILIIGAGTWGFSIALELARRGHTGIKVLDGCSFPSAISAGNDLNKIAEVAKKPSDSDTDEAYFWNHVSQVSMRAWNHDPLFKPFYHETGFIMAAVSDKAYVRCLEYAESENADLRPLNTKEQFQKTMPDGVLQGDFPGWRGFWKRSGAGWVFASGTMRAMYDEASRLGVQFVTGDPFGRVGELLYSYKSGTAIGARTTDGIQHIATHVFLAAGANSDQLLDFKKQLRPTAWTLAHLPLSTEETQRYVNLPVLYGVDRGFFIEPDVESHEIKICDEHPGYLNPVNSDNGEWRSVPFSCHQIPRKAEPRMRCFLSETMPQFANRKFSSTRICWDADTEDRIFLIDKHPTYHNLIMAVGGSGNGFMACPAIGVLVANLFEGKSGGRLRNMMRWRPERSVDRDWWDTQDRYGAEGKVMDFREVEDWTS
ncbi:FAD dependent oxidoreductase [Pyrenochaeta sp. MPI-SDFR-AT-0127]|nr:FAD dependent oxidoreductase [Pyrenochaeta sp. MPI-SDFR-AT-0127]